MAKPQVFVYTFKSYKDKIISTQLGPLGQGGDSPESVTLDETPKGIVAPP